MNKGYICRNGCNAKGKVYSKCSGKLTWAHIISRRFNKLAKNYKNSLCLCEAHRQYFNMMGEAFWMQFVEKYYPNQYEYVMREWYKDKYLS